MLRIYYWNIIKYPVRAALYAVDLWSGLNTKIIVITKHKTPSNFISAQYTYPTIAK